MKVKPILKSKTFRAQFEITFDAVDRAAALARAKELVDVPNARLVRVQESSLAWLTIPDSDAKSS